MEVTIPDSVASIGAYAFSGCSGLTGALVIPDGVTSIGAYAFFGCSGLTSVTIPGSVESIGDQAFSNCSGIRDVAVSQYVLDRTIQAVFPSTYTSLTNISYSSVITNIGSSAFYGCSGLTGALTIPDGVTSIGDQAFYGCSELTGVTIPDSVTNIGQRAFCNCIGLASVVITPGKGLAVGSAAFEGCAQLGAVLALDLAAWCEIDFADTAANPLTIAHDLYTLDGCELDSVLSGSFLAIPASVGKIGRCVFSGCSALTGVAIPNSVTNIGAFAFSDCSGLTGMTIPNSVVNIGSSAFSRCSGLTGVTIPNSVTNIGAFAFSGCSGLMSMTIPASVTSIAESTFSGCSGLANVEIPDCVASIGASAFSGCSGLTGVTIPGRVGIIANSTFSGCSGLTALTIPNGVTNIGASAFSGCSGLTRLIIPDGVTHIAASTFSGCSGLTALTIPSGVTNIGVSAFSGCSGLTAMAIPAGVTRIADSTFSGCSGLASVIIPEAVTNIGSSAFSGCSELADIAIPGRVADIGSFAFSRCSGLSRMTIPNSVANIGASAFSGCSGLTSMTLPFVGARRGNSGSSDAVLGYIFGTSWYAGSTDAQQNYSSGTSTYYVPASLRSVTITDETLLGYGAFSNCSGLTDVKIFPSVTSVGVYAFAGCSGLTRVMSIDASAFSSCSGLPGLTIPSSVTDIGASAFSGCSGLTSMTLPFVGARRGNSGTGEALFGYIFGTSTYAGGTRTKQYPYNYEYYPRSYYSSFYYSIPASLRSVTITDETVIGYGAFSNCSGLTDVKILPSVTSIGDYAFAGCGGLVNVIVPYGVESVGTGAFSGCGKLTCAVVPDTVTSIGARAFAECSSLESVYMLGLEPPANYGNIYAGTPADLVTYVPVGSMGWFFPGYSLLPDAWPIGDDADAARPISYGSPLLTTVAFDANGGEMDVLWRSVLYLVGQPLGMLPDAARDGYVFDGWWTAKSGGSRVTEETQVASGMAVYAHWTANTYELGYDNQFLFERWANSASGASANGELTVDLVNGSFTLANRASGEVYTHFATGGNVSGYYLMPVAGEAPHTMSLSLSSGGTFAGNVDVFLFYFGGTTNYLSNERGVLSGSGSKAFAFTPPAGAAWAQVRFDVNRSGDTVTFRDIKVCRTEPYADVDISAVRKPYVYLLGDHYGELLTPTRPGYAFVGWYTGENGTGTRITGASGIVPRSQTVWSHWTAKSYTLTVDPNGGAYRGRTVPSVFPTGTGSASLVFGTTQYRAIGTAARTGYAFAGWWTEPEGGEQVYDAAGAAIRGTYWTDASANGGTYRHDGDLTVYAHWTANTYELGYDNQFLFERWANSASGASANGELTVDLVNGSFTLANTTSGEVYTLFTAGGGVSRYYLMPVTGGAAHTMSLSLSSGGTFAGSVDVYLFYFGGTTNYLSNERGMLSGSGGKSFAFTPPAGAVWAQVRFDVNKPGDTVTFSDIKVCRTESYADVDLSAVRKPYAYADGGTYGALATPKRSGYSFVGWFTGENGTGTQITEDSAMAPRSQTVYSHWQPQAGLDAWLAAQNLKADDVAANGRTAAECYALGLDPTDATNDFRIVSIEMVDGKPKVEWEPKTNRWTGEELNVVLKGAVSLDGPWDVVQEGGEAAYRFFKVVVELP